MYSKETVEYVRECNDITCVINETLGINAPAMKIESIKTCPFCGDDSGSFFVNKETGCYMCFSCGEGGDAFSYIMKKYNRTFNQSVEILAGRAGISIMKEHESSAEITEKEDLYKVNKEAALYFVKNLYASKDGYSYITDRKLSKKTLIKFGIGFANGREDDLSRNLLSKGYSKDIIIKAGLAVENGSNLRDRFRNRIIFPIIDKDGMILGFGGRIILPDVKPKYLNSPDNLIFDKGANLYGINSMQPGKAIILCEGYMDVITMQQAGFNAVASLGTAFTNLQAKVIRNYTDTVYLSYDNDDAGKIAQQKAKKLLYQTGLKGMLLDLSPVKDPDEFIKKFGEEEFKKRILQAIAI